MMAMLEAGGYVWCDKNLEVHHRHAPCHRPEDHHRLYYSNPETEEIMKCGLCESGMHCEVHDGPIEPEPVRSNPVPLIVRRHTEESMAIWRANLLNALPADLPDEDAQRIADELLEVAISESTTLRRRRLVGRLMDEAETLEDLGQRPVPKPVRGELFALWSNLMMDAAEEIRSVL